MSRELPTRPTAFVFAPALYPESPLNEQPVFVHGAVNEVKQGNRETIIRARDEKGEWEAYVGGVPAQRLEKGMKVRGFGIVERQPDGKTVLAARWVKNADEKEYEFCVRETQKEWEKMVQENPQMEELKPYTPPKNKPAPLSAHALASKPAESDEFISAHELKVERDFV